MKRFTKAKLVADLEVYASAVRVRNGFRQGHGTHQLLPKNPTDREKELLNRAYEYGRCTAADDFASWICNGEFGA